MQMEHLVAFCFLTMENHNSAIPVELSDRNCAILYAATKPDVSGFVAFYPSWLMYLRMREKTTNLSK
jgi:hypothetical protein